MTKQQKNKLDERLNRIGLFSYDYTWIDKQKLSIKDVSKAETIQNIIRNEFNIDSVLQKEVTLKIKKTKKNG